MLSINDLILIINEIHGWISEAEAYALYKLSLKNKYYGVEIGSFKGKSTICLGLGSLHGNNNKIITIDHHSGNTEHKKRYGEIFTFNELYKNIKNVGLQDIIIPVITDSKNMLGFIPDNSCGLIFIDGSHEYDDVVNDILNWTPKIISGGIIACHDSRNTSWLNVEKAVNEHVVKSNNFKNILGIDSLTLGEKK